MIDTRNFLRDTFLLLPVATGHYARPAGAVLCSAENWCRRCSSMRMLWRRWTP